MKNKIIIGVLIALFLGFFSFMGAGYYFVHYVAKPEKVRSMVLKSLKEQFPNAKHSLGSIEYSLFPGLHLTVKKLEMSLEKKGTKLIKLKDIVVDIPILNVLKGGGRFLVKIDSPEINFEQFKKTNNWTLAMGSPKVKKVTITEKHTRKVQKEENKKSEKITVPAFVAQSFLDVHINNAKVTYLIGENRGNFDIDKFALKKVGLVGESAFEMVAKLHMKMGPRSLSCQPVLIGTFNLNEILYKKTMKVPVDLKIGSLKISPENWNFPLIVNRLVLQIHKSGKIEGDYAFQMKESNSIKTNLLIDNGTTKLQGMEAHFRLQDFQELFHISIPDLRLGKSEVVLKGSVSIEDQNIDPKIQVDLTSGLEYVFKGETAKVKANIALTREQVNVKSIVDMFQGQVVTKIHKKLPRDFTQLLADKNPVYGDVEVKGMKIHKNWIESNFLTTSTKSVSADANKAGATKNLSKEQKSRETKLFLLPFQFNLKLSDLSLEDALLNGKCAMSLEGVKHQVKNCSFDLDQGQIIMSEAGRISSSLITSDAIVTVKNINIASLQAALPSKLGRVSGLVNSELKVTSEIKNDNISYQGLFKVKASNGEIEKLPVAKWVQDYLSNVTILKALNNKKLNLSNAFKQIDTQGTFSEKKSDITKFLFVGLKDKITLSGKGHIYPFVQFKGESEIVGTLKDKIGISTVLQKNVGIDYLPLRAAGQNLAILPDYNYTIKKIEKALLKRTSKKIKKKAQKKVEKAIEKKLGSKAEKLLKNKKVKKLLKGLFD